MFFKQQEKSDSLDLLNNAEWIAELSYPADVLAVLNELNSSLEGAQKDVFSLGGNIDASTGKITLWQQAVADGDFQMFPCLIEELHPPSRRRACTRSHSWQVL